MRVLQKLKFVKYINQYKILYEVVILDGIKAWKPNNIGSILGATFKKTLNCPGTSSKQITLHVKVHVNVINT